MGVIDRTLKILCRHYPEWPQRLLFGGERPQDLEIVRLEINLPERRFDDAYRIILEDGEEKFLFVEFLFGEDRRELFKYFTKAGMASALCGYGKVGVIVIQMTEGLKKPLEPFYRVDIAGVENSFKMSLIYLNDFLPQIESGEFYQYGPLLPLLKGRADNQTLVKVRELINRESDRKRRRDLYSLAVTVSGRYLDKELLWEHFKEELEMIRESEIVKEWIREGIQQGIQQGMLQTARETLIETLETRFDIIPRSLMHIIDSVDEPSLLKRLHKKALTATSLNKFREDMEEMIK